MRPRGGIRRAQGGTGGFVFGRGDCRAFSETWGSVLAAPPGVENTPGSGEVGWESRDEFGDANSGINHSTGLILWMF